MEIYVDNRQEKVEITEGIMEILEKVVQEVLIFEEKPLDSEVSISFVGNEEIRELNKEYRGIDRETDVLSFPIDDDFIIDGPILLGDVIISAEKALEQANDFGHSLNREMAYLTAHSMFHLLGYDHIDEDDKLIMRSREKEIMKRLKIFKDNKGE